MSFFNAVYGDQDLSSRAKMVCLYLHDRANKDGESWYAIGSIARDLHLSRSTVKRAIQDLLRLGWIEKRPRYREKVPSRFMRKIVCRLRLSEVNRQ